MNSIPNVVIVTSRCSRTRQYFGIRFEEAIRGQWIADWAFPIKETLAKKEGYNRNQITGTFSFASEYPGCPDCQAKSIFKCNCGKIACWNVGPLPCTVVCPCCGSVIVLS